MKKQLAYQCTVCGTRYVKWQGECVGCHNWNTIEALPEAHTTINGDMPLVTIDESVQRATHTKRISTGFSELDQLMGGGIVSGSITLIGGEPGIGKSTLLLQILHNISQSHQSHQSHQSNLKSQSHPLYSTVYLSGEESADQIGNRAQRLHLQSSGLKIAMIRNLGAIVSLIESKQADFIVIDSIQTVETDDNFMSGGSAARLRDVFSRLMNAAKKNHITLFVIGHITKEGQLAGPKTLEHMVDTVLYFEGDPKSDIRFIRVQKNRFGKTGEVALFTMEHQGLIPLSHTEQIFLGENIGDTFGSSIFPALEGSRVFFVECQALVVSSFLPSPRRTCVGWDVSRLHTLLAVLEARMSVPLSSKDVYITIANGFRLQEPTADLAIAASILSASYAIPLSKDTLFIGEVALSGQITPPSRASKRLQDIEKFGFHTVVGRKPNTHMPVKVHWREIHTISQLPPIIKGT